MWVRLNDFFFLFIGNSRSKMRILNIKSGFLRMRISESPLSTRPQPEEAQKWSESFVSLMASKCKSSLKSKQMSKGHEKKWRNSCIYSFLLLQMDRHFIELFYFVNSATRIWNFGWPLKTTRTPNRKRWQPKHSRFTTTL